MDNNGEPDSTAGPSPSGDAAPDRTQQVIYAVSHDLRAPARHINAFLGLLVAELGEGLDEVSAGYIERVIAAADALDTKLDALGTFSRVMTTGAPLGPCSVGDAVAAALGVLQPEIERAGARIEVGDLPLVMADSKQLAEVFVELIGNSLKFCAPGVCIVIEACLSGGRVVVCVSDDGPGFTDEHPERALELFRRFHGATVPGTGAGLAIVERIVARHGGQMSIETGTEQGTTVRLGFVEAVADAS